MKPWQAWAVTVSIVLMCTMDLINFIEIRWFAFHLGEEMEKTFGTMSTSDRAFQERLNREMEQIRKKSDSLLPEKPKGRAVYTPPQR